MVRPPPDFVETFLCLQPGAGGAQSARWRCFRIAREYTLTQRVDSLPYCMSRKKREQRTQKSITFSFPQAAFWILRIAEFAFRLWKEIR
jgi:hypothetical protein